MIYRGQIRGGVVILPPDIQLPDGTDVYVEPIIVSTPASEAAGSFTGVVRNGVPLFPRHEGGTTVNIDLVNRLRDETL